MEKTGTLKSFLKDLFSTQRLAVLATQSEKQPYGSLVAFAATRDLRHLLFATTRATRKYDNISSNPRIAMVVDNRSNQEADFYQAAAVTATGVVKETEGRERVRFQKLYLAKHPYLKEFVSSPTCALLKVEVDAYYVVRHFQNVVKLPVKKKGASIKGRSKRLQKRRFA
ncbi:MAG: pyridoxamine 5'-phosphate oxidase family protein [Desulfobacterota bacterium]|nr:pyridoxamine 5'-phosphate oxidase family protein [Thermodesulfobacteriota bacterium]